MTIFQKRWECWKIFFYLLNFKHQLYNHFLFPEKSASNTVKVTSWTGATKRSLYILLPENGMASKELYNEFRQNILDSFLRLRLILINFASEYLSSCYSVVFQLPSFTYFSFCGVLFDKNLRTIPSKNEATIFCFTSFFNLFHASSPSSLTNIQPFSTNYRHFSDEECWDEFRIR